MASGEGSLPRKSLNTSLAGIDPPMTRKVSRNLKETTKQNCFILLVKNFLKFYCQRSLLDFSMNFHSKTIYDQQSPNRSRKDTNLSDLLNKELNH